MPCYVSNAFFFSMQAIVESDHHFNTNLQLSVINDEWLLYVKGKLLDPAESKSSFVDVLLALFGFTGVSPGQFWSIGPLERYSEQHLESVQRILELIYATPLEHKIELVSIGTCGCNMGYCSKVTSVEIIEPTCNTYGDVMALFGCTMETAPDQISYYEYPDSMLLCAETVTQRDLPIEIYDITCYSEPKPCTLELDPDVCYISFQYVR